jgi:hypothetical protein
MQAEKGDVFVAAPESPPAAHQLLHAEPEEIKFMYYNRKDNVRAVGMPEGRSRHARECPSS